MRLEVIGEPQPQGNKSTYHNASTGHTAIVEGKGKAVAAVKDWRGAVATAAREELKRNPQPPMSGPIEVRIFFRFAPVKSAPFRFWHTTRPDLDKLARAVFDALKMGGAIADDSRICSLTTKKRYVNDAEAIGCTVELESLEADEEQLRELRKQRAREARAAS